MFVLTSEECECVFPKLTTLKLSKNIFENVNVSLMTLLNFKNLYFQNVNVNVSFLTHSRFFLLMQVSATYLLVLLISFAKMGSQFETGKTAQHKLK